MFSRYYVSNGFLKLIHGCLVNDQDRLIGLKRRGRKLAEFFEPFCCFVGIDGHISHIGIAGVAVPINHLNALHSLVCQAGAFKMK